MQSIEFTLRYSNLIVENLICSNVYFLIHKFDFFHLKLNLILLSTFQICWNILFSLSTFNKNISLVSEMFLDYKIYLRKFRNFNHKCYKKNSIFRVKSNDINKSKNTQFRQQNNKYTIHLMNDLSTCYK